MEYTLKNFLEFQKMQVFMLLNRKITFTIKF